MLPENAHGTELYFDIVNKWTVGWIIALSLALLTVLNMSRGTALLADTDTRVMLERIDLRNNPLSWFTGDWPLNNHFYRPIVATTFEIDHKLYGWNPHGFAATNAILCAFCILTLFWFVRELFDDLNLAILTTSLFTLSTIGFRFHYVLGWLTLGAGILAALLSFNSKGQWAIGIGTALAAYAASYELSGFVDVNGGMLGWIPGRTASTMTIFCFAACAAYARYERLSANRLALPEPTPLDPPATKSSQFFEPRKSKIWAILSIVSIWLALASYEQAVMLPACLFGVAVTLRLKKIQVRWLWQIPFWGMLGVYFLQRKYLLPSGTSDYQRQQFRSGPDVFYTLGDYLFPASRSVQSLKSALEIDILALLNEGRTLLFVLAWVSLFVFAIPWIRNGLKSRNPNRVLPLLTGYVLSFVAFMPMAWMKSFSYNHYHYWALGYRSLFAAGLVILLGDLVTRATSRRALQAPQRPSPAPGSLPRP